MGEVTPIAPPASVYGATKQMSERILFDLVASQAPVRVMLLRYFNPIGAHPSARIGELPLGDPQNLAPIILQSAAGLRGLVQIFGDDWSTPDGTCIRDFIHVVNLAEAHVRALAWMRRETRASLIEVLNVGTGRGASVRDAIGAFERATGLKVPTRVGPRRDGDIEQIYASVEKSARLLDWRAKRSLEDAMRDAWRWQQTLPPADESTPAEAQRHPEDRGSAAIRADKPRRAHAAPDGPGRGKLTYMLLPVAQKGPLLLPIRYSPLAIRERRSPAERGLLSATVS